MNPDCLEYDQIDWKAFKSRRPNDLETCREESDALQRFRALLDESWRRVIHTDPCACLRGHDHDGAPDFLIQRECDVLGVEVTTLTNDKLARERNSRSTIRDRVVDEYENLDGPICEIYLTLNNSLDTRSESVGEVAKEIAAIAARRVPDQANQISKFEVCEVYKARRAQKLGMSYNAFLADLSAIQGLVSSMSIRRPVDAVKTQVVAPRPGVWVPTWNENDLQDDLQKKIDRHARYLEHCSELWLLAVYGVERSLSASAGEMTLDIENDIQLDVPFDRVYALKGSDQLRRLA